MRLKFNRQFALTRLSRPSSRELRIKGTVINTGSVEWDNTETVGIGEFKVGFILRQKDASAVISEGRCDFTGKTVSPDQTLNFELPVNFTDIEDGEYTLDLDIVKEGSFWFFNESPLDPLRFAVRVAAEGIVIPLNISSSYQTIERPDGKFVEICGEVRRSENELWHPTEEDYWVHLQATEESSLEKIAWEGKVRLHFDPRNTPAGGRFGFIIDTRMFPDGCYRFGLNMSGAAEHPPYALTEQFQNLRMNICGGDPLVFEKASCASPSGPEERQPAENPWLPWREPNERPGKSAGGILAVIPTAGRDIERLSRCIERAQAAAGDERLRIVVVLCPATEETEGNVRRVIGARCELISLEGPFNYCRSINAGVKTRTAADGYILFLNDDTYFTRENDLKRLKETLVQKRWAVIGPWIDGPGHYETRRPAGPEIKFWPVTGCCALWDAAWLARIGELDEKFGEGWGLDESDLHLRAVRRGAIWGWDGSISVEHEHHATFGWEHTRLDGEAAQKNYAYFRQKYGPGVHEFGGSIHWHPLPGIHVAIAGHNVAKWIRRCMESVERALDGYRWIFSFADDASTDGTLDFLLHDYSPRSTADEIIIRKVPKQSSAAAAKNQAIGLGNHLRQQYPALCLMDADDEMAPARIRHLLWKTRNAGVLMSHGSFEYRCDNLDAIDPSFGGIPNPALIEPTPAQMISGHLHPCSTIIHRSLIPADGRLFDETMPVAEDSWLWLNWYADGVRSLSLPGQITHFYHIRPGSVMRSPQSKMLFEEIYWQRRLAFIESHNIPAEGISA